jgi:hypothetical protein
MDKTDPVSILCGVLAQKRLAFITEIEMHRLLNSVGLRITSTQRLLVDDHLSRVRALGAGDSLVKQADPAASPKPPGHG